MINTNEIPKKRKNQKNKKILIENTKRKNTLNKKRKIEYLFDFI